MPGAWRKPCCRLHCRGADGRKTGPAIAAGRCADAPASRRGPRSVDAAVRNSGRRVARAVGQTSDGPHAPRGGGRISAGQNCARHREADAHCVPDDRNRPHASATAWIRHGADDRRNLGAGHDPRGRSCDPRGRPCDPRGRRRDPPGRSCDPVRLARISCRHRTFVPDGRRAPDGRRTFARRRFARPSVAHCARENLRRVACRGAFHRHGPAMRRAFCR